MLDVANIWDYENFLLFRVNSVARVKEKKIETAKKKKLMLAHRAELWDWGAHKSSIRLLRAPESQISVRRDNITFFFSDFFCFWLAFLTTNNCVPSNILQEFTNALDANIHSHSRNTRSSSPKNEFVKKWKKCLIYHEYQDVERVTILPRRPSKKIFLDKTPWYFV